MEVMVTSDDMRRSITSLISIALLGTILGKGLRYGLNVVIARGLGTEALGVFAFGLVLMRASAVLARLGLDRAAQKYVPLYRTEGDLERLVGTVLLCIGVTVLVGSALALLLTLGGAVVDDLVRAELGSTTALFSLGIPLFSAMVVGMAATRGFKETRYAVYIREVGQSVPAIVMIALSIYLFGSFRAVVASYVLSLLIGLLVAIYFLAKLGGISLNVRPAFEVREILSFSLPLTLAATTLYLISWTDILMLGVFEPPDMVGWYQAAYQTSVLLAILLQATNSLFPSLASDLYHTGELQKLDKVFTGMTRWITYFTLFGFALLVVNARNVMSIFGEPSQIVVLTLLVLGTAQALSAATGPIGFLLSMTGHERVQTMNAVVVFVVNVALNFYLIQMYGILGAATATGFSFVLSELLRLGEAWHFLGIQPYDREYWKGFVAVGLSLPAMLVAEPIVAPGLGQLFVSGVLSFCVFAAVLWTFGLNDVDRMLLESID